MVALNLGTIIVLILAALFFGGIIFLASQGGAPKPEENPDIDEKIPEKPVRPVKHKQGLRQATRT